MPGYGRPYKRRKRKRNGWATQRATMQSIPRLTFKPMQLMRRSMLELTAKISFASGMAAGLAGTRKNGIWWYTLNTNSIFPIHRQGNLNDLNDGTEQWTPTATVPATQIVKTVWENSPSMPASTNSPRILPSDGATLAQMRARPRPATYPTVAPGLFEEDSSPGYQYAEIAVVGTKVTAHWVPLVSDLDNQALDQPANAANGYETEESRLFMFPQTQQSGQPYFPPPGDNTANALIDADSAWANELETIPYIKSRTISGFTAQNKFTGQGVGNATANKLGNGAVLTYAVSPAAIHGVRNISDEKALWSRNTLPLLGTVDKRFQHPAERNYLTIGICKSLKNIDKRCPPSGKLTLRIEQTLLMREPMATRTIEVRAEGAGAGQPAAGPAAGSNPGGSFFPGNPYSAGRIGANLAAAAALAANFT